ncbi:LamG domain-containing protein [Colwellia echini]|uniref:LamG domain-containing protein n=1 Tax=Colwellia echini TaxID=1982103 RepID=A0ABY3N0Y3_9GAMM|nr:LamG domain-containing protein [Colwellia echini]TYK67153.1 LamG domain-containing protein [Colwellia echini]
MAVRVWFYFVFLVLFSHGVRAVECPVVFPDGIQNNDEKGIITFNYHGQLKNSPDNILATNQGIIDLSGDDWNSCESGACTESFSIAHPVDITDFGAGEDGDITAIGAVAITKSPGNYKDLLLPYQSSLTLEPGDYYFTGNFINNSQNNIAIDGNGVVRIFVQGIVTLGYQTGLNENGSPSQLLLYSADNIAVGNEVNVSGFIYSKEDVTIAYQSYVKGAISAKNLNPSNTEQVIEFSDEVPDFGDFCEKPPSYCEITFVNGATTFGGGEIRTSGSPIIVNDSTGILRTDKLNVKDGTFMCNDINGTGVSQNCIRDTTNGDTQELNNIPFISGSGGNSLNITSSVTLGSGSYDTDTFKDITIKDGGNLTFSNNHSVYYINKLTVLADDNDGDSATINLAPGDYYISTFDTNQNTTIVSSGTVRVLIENSSDFKGNTRMNIGGAPEDFLIYNRDDDIYVHDSSEIHGLLYAKNNLSLYDSVKLVGAASGGRVELTDTSQIYYTCDAYIPTPEPIPDPSLNYRYDECIYEGDPKQVIDETGNYNADIYGVLSPDSDAVINNSLDLSASGTSDWLSVPKNAINGLNDFSVSFWLKKSSDNTNATETIIHAVGDSATDDQLMILLKGDGSNNSYVRVFVADVSVDLTTDATSLSDGNWNHVVVTRQANNVCLFVNGNNTDCDGGASSDTLSVTHDNAVVMGLGKDSVENDVFVSDQGLEAKLDEFKIFQAKLSDNQVLEIFTNEDNGLNYNGSDRAALECCSATPGELSAVGIRIGDNGSDTQITTTTEALAIHAAWLAAGSPVTGYIDNNKYEVAASGSSQADRIDFGGREHDYSDTLPYPGASAGVGGTDFLVYASGTLRLPAGDYTIYVEADDGFSFVMDSLEGDVVTFSKFGSSTVGDSNELRYETPTGNSNTGGSFTLTQTSIFNISTIFFERGGGDYLEVSIANDIRSNAAPSGYEVLKHGALNGKVRFGDCIIGTQIQHYQIIHDGRGLTCEPEVVTIKACTNSYDGTCIQSDETVSVTVKALGSEAVTDSISFTGEGNASIAYTVAESSILSIENASIEAISPTVCFNGSTTSCELVFADTGFRFFSNNEGTIIPEQLSAKPSNIGFNNSTLKLQAIEKSPETGACQAALIDAENIEMAATCVDPVACAGSNVTINNLISDTPIETLNNSASKTYSNIGLNFGGNTVNNAEFIFTYPDAGKVQLHARYNIPDADGNPSGNYMLGSSNAFVVRPLGFFIDVTGNPKAQSATQANSVFKKAGENFTTSLTAVQWQAADDTDENGIPDDNADLSNNTATVNFGNESSVQNATITPSLYLPNPGTEGVLTNVDFTNFSDGVATNGTTNNKSMTYDEVGIVSFTANLTNGAYLGASDIIGTEPYVGRFTPAYFTQTVYSHGLLNANHYDTCTENTWAYAGQTRINGVTTTGAISYDSASGGIPVIEINAYNIDGNLTENYTETGFKKLVKTDIDITAPIKDDEELRLPIAAGDNIIINSVMTVGDDLVVSEAGKLRYTFNATDHFIYEHSEASKIAPFTAKIPFVVTSVEDSDEIELYAGADSNIEPTEKVVTAGVDIRFGRWLLENSYGPETSQLPMDMAIEIFDGINFIPNALENCLVPKVGDVELSGTVGDGGMTLWDYRLADLDVTDNLLTTQTTPIIDDELPFGIGSYQTFELGLYDLLYFSPPGAGRQGSLDFEYQVPSWLQYDWNNDSNYNNNPTAKLTFGLYRGNDRIIYQREISR